MSTRRLVSGVRLRARGVSIRLLRARPALASWLFVAARLVIPRRLRRRIYRSFSWPLARALAVRLVVPAAGGRMEVDTGDTVGTVIAVSGIWEPHITAVVRRLVSPGDVFVDVGAHIGYYTLLASSLVGERGHVYAFEPSRARCDELRANLARNTMANVTVLEVAAGSRNGIATLYEAPRTNTAASTVVPAALDPRAGTDYSPTQVSVEPVQARVAPAHLDRVRVVKVDVEGFEIEVLRGLERVIAAGRPLGLIVEISPEWSAENQTRYLEQLCRAHEFVPWRVPNEYTVDAYFPTRLRHPIRLESIPEERADLLLLRGLDLANVRLRNPRAR